MKLFKTKVLKLDARMVFLILSLRCLSSTSHKIRWTNLINSSWLKTSQCGKLEINRKLKSLFHLTCKELENLWQWISIRTNSVQMRWLLITWLTISLRISRAIQRCRSIINAHLYSANSHKPHLKINLSYQKCSKTS
jgi:hypothetical protein